MCTTVWAPNNGIIVSLYRVSSQSQDGTMREDVINFVLRRQTTFTPFIVVQTMHHRIYLVNRLSKFRRKEEYTSILQDYKCLK